MNQIKWEPYDRLKPGDIMRILGLRSHDDVKRVLKSKGINSKPIYGRSFTIKYSELAKAGLIHEGNS